MRKRREKKGGRESEKVEEVKEKGRDRKKKSGGKEERKVRKGRK